MRTYLPINGRVGFLPSTCSTRIPRQVRGFFCPHPVNLRTCCLTVPFATQRQSEGLLMHMSDGFTDAIGNTPLIRLRRLSDETGCEILGKAEFMNPGGSVKDRAAKWIVLDAERRGLLKPGGTVVEGTAGNTGIGLAHVCNARGYRVRDRDARQSGGREIPDHRGPGRRTAQGAGRALQQSQSIPKGGRAPRAGASRRHLGQSIRQYRESRRSFRVDGPRDLAGYRR